MVKMINNETKVIVQGITGTQGRFHTKLMLEYGTKIVAGSTPGRGGQEVEGVPVYDTVIEAKQAKGGNASIIYVPASGTLDAALEAIEAKLDPIVIITEGIPVRDTIEILAHAKQKEITIIGPNTPGIIKAGESKMGIMPAQIFSPGKIGIISRSGTLFYEVAAHITNVGLGETTCIGIGGDPIVGLDYVSLLKWFQEDSETKGVALIGEIGGDAEERAADFIASGGFTKPISAYIAGRAAIPGKRMGHAGAIISGGTGTAEGKMNALRAAGVYVGLKPIEVAKTLKNVLNL
ncbi:succinate--CoA ligase subunit alpha [Candidatus Bathyarchaeota archaeon]|nr:succinate--CoA ligase subunit alpha [Candidatus Bathyarchaeota archaeon]